jgi:transcription elongation GreA/GreB family factor
MKDIANDVPCRACGRPLVQKAGRGHRKRAYCNAACKMKERRRLLAAQQQVRAKEAQAQLAALEKQVRALEARLAALQSVNECFRNDTQVRAFGW